MQHKTPLRYPGGKSRAIATLSQHTPDLREIKEYREPFIGGGSMFFYMKQTCPQLKFWINDLNPEVYYFWQTCQNQLTELITEILKEKSRLREETIRDYYNYLINIELEKLTELERAKRFFILNRISFGGTTEAGGFSITAYRDRFKYSSINNLFGLDKILDGVQITNLDYTHLIKSGGGKVFTFLDPPYAIANNCRLYGKNGSLHKTFSHNRLKNWISQCRHHWMITYNFSDYIADMYCKYNRDFYVLPYSLRRTSDRSVKELIIKNY